MKQQIRLQASGGEAVPYFLHGKTESRSGKATQIPQKQANTRLYPVRERSLAKATSQKKPLH